MKSYTQEALRLQPQLKNLRDRQLLYSGVYDGSAYLPAQLSTIQLEYNEVVVKIASTNGTIAVPGACLVAWPSWDEVGEDGDLQVVRATPSIYGHECYDFVSFQRKESPSRSYAHLQLLAV
jgi:hypothetical protein